MTTIILAYAVVLMAISSIVDAGTEEENQREAEEYFRRFEYMGSPLAKKLGELTNSNESFETAISSFQRMAGLNVTGRLSTETMDWMRKPRCGMPDFTAMGSIARRRRRYVAQGSRWPRTSISYNFSNFSPDLPNETIKSEIKRAIAFWTDVTPLYIYESSSKTADIEVRFGPRDHGDANPFDGPGKVLAHAFFPEFGGDIHFDEDESWTEATTQGTNLLNIAVHELGHSLGLGHSTVKGAIMAPFYSGYNPNLALHADDIEGIQYLYGVKSTLPPTTMVSPQKTSPRGVSSLGSWCASPKVDAIFSIDRVMYAFRGNEYIELDEHGVVSGYPRNISATFYSLPSSLDAAMYLSDSISSNTPRGVYFFKDSMCWLYSKQTNRQTQSVVNPQMFMLMSGYPKNLSSVFIGLPDKLDAAYVWTGNGKPYFIKGDKYFRFSKGNILDVGFPRNLGAWKGLPKSIDSAFNSQLTGRTYFFKDDEFYRFNDIGFKVDVGYPQKTAEVWMGCFSAGRNLVEKEVNEGRDQFMMMSSTTPVMTSSSSGMTSSRTSPAWTTSLSATRHLASATLCLTALALLVNVQ